MTATILKFPRQTGPAIRCVDPAPKDEDEFKAAAALCLIASERPEKRAEIAERVGDFLARQRGIL